MMRYTLLAIGLVGLIFLAVSTVRAEYDSEEAKSGEAEEYIIKEVKRRYGFGKVAVYKWLERVGRLLTDNTTRSKPDDSFVPSAACPESFDPDIKCDPKAKYRTFDGSCNNIRHPLWGRANTPHIRWLKNDYADGIKAPRVSENSQPLPSARLVTSTVHTDSNKPSLVHAITMMTTGQLLDHDITRTPIAKLPDPSDSSKSIDVTCGEDDCGEDSPGMEECLPIKVPEGDTCFKQTKCLKFIRSQPVLDLKCRGDLSTKPRQQMNEITSYIDASFVYGSSEEQANSLREENSGRMLLTTNPLNHDMKPLLPPVDDPECANVNDDVKCMKAGDTRVNEWVGLTTFHTIFARQHNRIADELLKINPDLANENDKLFKEARRIVIALWQRIIFKEYLPVVLGKEHDKFELKLKKTDDRFGYYRGYDRNRNAQTSNVFEGAAFRFGHSQVDAFIRFINDQKFRNFKEEEISLHQFRPLAVYESGIKGGVDTILRGHVHKSAQERDAHFTEQVTCHLFTKNPPFGEGTDLPALNIQRGREHGLPGYNDWREFCNLPRIRGFGRGHRPTDIPEDIWTKLASVYKHVDDIDVFSGGVSEHSVEFGVVGPTFACMIGKQFENMRKGDRYWHENIGPGMFTPDQLKAIDKASSLSRIMCETSDDIDYLQPKALLLPLSEIPSQLRSYELEEEIKFLYGSSKNERVRCSEQPKLDLSAWKDMM